MSQGILSPARLSRHDILLATGRPAMTIPIGTTKTLNDLYLEGELLLFCEAWAEVVSVSGMPSFVMRSYDSLFGASLIFPLPLKKSAPYKFNLILPENAFKPTDEFGYACAAPDLVVVDGRVRWRRTGRSREVSFTVKPRNAGHLQIYLIKSVALSAGLIPRGKLPVAVARPALELTFDCDICIAPADRAARVSDIGPSPLRDDLRRWRSPRIYAEASHYTPIEWDPPPVEKPPYPTDDVTICGYHEPIAGVKDSPSLQQQLIALYERNGINALHWNAFYESLPALLDEWREGRALGIRTLFFSFPIVDKTNGGPADLSAVARHVNALTTEFPHLNIVMRAAEPDTTQQREFLEPAPMRKATFGLRRGRMRELIAQSCRRNLLAFRSRLKHPERVRILFQMAGLNGQGSDWYRFGADVVLTKTIHRQCVNLVVATARGTALPFRRPFGLEYDSWNGRFYHHNGVNEPEFIIASLFFGGADYLDCEYAHLGLLGEKIAPNAGGVHWLALGRLVAIHPRRGRQRVRIAFARGSEDQWFRPTGVGGNGHGQPPMTGQGARTWQWPDWNLLDLVFPKFGNVLRANHERFGTGTPYGPVDVIPWDAPAEGLQNYGVVVLIGENNMTSEQAEKWREYVRHGGKLVLSLGSMRKSDGFQIGPAPKSLFRRLAGVELLREEELGPESYNTLIPYHPRFFGRCITCGAEIMERMPKGAPLLTRFQIGKGEVFFYTTETITLLGEEGPRSLLSQLFEELTEVRFSPSSDWLAYTVSQRDDISLLAIINHGQARYPSDLGEDVGPWNGRISANIGALGIPSPCEVLALDRQMKTKKIGHLQRGEWIEFRASVDRWQEFVIGPLGRTRELLFS